MCVLFVCVLFVCLFVVVVCFFCFFFFVLFFFCFFVFCFFVVFFFVVVVLFVCFCVNITVFRVSVPLPCIPITPISIHTFLKVLELLSLESLSAILEYKCALQQQQKSKKMCHLMFSVETFARVTCMLDNNLLINRVLYIV